MKNTSRYILTFLWGATTIASWFLAWNYLGVSNMKIPNGFLAGAIISTLIAIGTALFLAICED